jgi:hypothetical protein
MQIESRCAETIQSRDAVVRWIEGFEPCRTDMVFERESPSCFAGFGGESAWIPDLDRPVPSQS